MSSKRHNIYLSDNIIAWLANQPRDYNFSDDIRTMLCEKYGIEKTVKESSKHDKESSHKHPIRHNTAN